jgi:hypothetical protein
LFVASELGVSPDQVLFAKGDSCDDFEVWQRVIKSGISVDFRRILRFGFGILDLKSYQFDKSMIEEMCKICDSADIEICLYWRIEDHLQMIVKSIFFTEFIEEGLIEKEIEKLINLSHPCIAAPIGFVFEARSLELKVFGLYSENASLFEVLRANPAWWTPTVKAKAVAGLVLGLRFVHSFGLIHGFLTTKNIHFDLNHRIEMTNFFRCLSGNDLSGFSRERWNPETDIRGFVSILFEIVVGCPAKDETDIPADVPMFVSEMIKTGLWGEWRILSSFENIFKTLELQAFKIMCGVDLAEVLSFVSWVEELEQCRE